MARIMVSYVCEFVHLNYNKSTKKRVHFITDFIVNDVIDRLDAQCFISLPTHFIV